MLLLLILVVLSHEVRSLREMWVQRSKWFEMKKKKSYLIGVFTIAQKPVAGLALQCSAIIIVNRLPSQSKCRVTSQQLCTHSNSPKPVIIARKARNLHKIYIFRLPMQTSAVPVAPSPLFFFSALVERPPLCTYALPRKIDRMLLTGPPKMGKDSLTQLSAKTQPV